MIFALSDRSKARLKGVNHEMVRVIEESIKETEIDFTVLEGLRSEKRQKALVKSGDSWTMKSRHLTGHAVDIAPIIDGKIPWDNADIFVQLSKVLFRVADGLGVIVQWGGDWDMDGDWRDESRFDGPHFQIPFNWNLQKAKLAQEKRVMLGTVLKEGSAVEPVLSPDITPGLKPEDMNDSEFDSGGFDIEEFE